MQQYIHGHTILDHKLCRIHHEAELRCLPLDYEFDEWENAVKSQLSSLGSSESLLANAPTIRPIGVIVGIGMAIVGLVGGDPELLGPLLGMGALLAIGSMLLPKIAAANIKTAKGKLAGLKQNMPQANPPDRPLIAGRPVPNFTENDVKIFIYS
jgi:hypothetical protein